MDKKAKADELHSSGYNCCQAVICAFFDKEDPEYTTLFKAGEGLGFGLGCGKGLCGALSGAVMVAGMANSSASLDKPDSKLTTYKIAHGIYEEFEKRVGATYCSVIKGFETGRMLCSCPDCVRIGTEIAEKVVEELKK